MTATKTYDGSLVIPCFNEGPNLSDLYDIVSSETFVRVEIIIVDNGSTDKTSEILDSLQVARPRKNISVIRVPENKGYGFGVLSGLRHSSADLIGWMHADLQTPLTDYLKAVDLAQNRKVNFVKGVRHRRASFDQFVSLGMGVICSAVLGVKLIEVNAQPTLFNRDLLDDFREDAPANFNFDLYVYYLAMRRGWNRMSFDVVFGDRNSGVSTWNRGLWSKFKMAISVINFAVRLRLSYGSYKAPG